MNDYCWLFWCVFGTSILPALGQRYRERRQNKKWARVCLLNKRNPYRQVERVTNWGLRCFITHTIYIRHAASDRNNAYIECGVRKEGWFLFAYFYCFLCAVLYFVYVAQKKRISTIIRKIAFTLTVCELNTPLRSYSKQFHGYSHTHQAYVAFIC